MHACMHAYTYIHTCIHTCIHVHSRIHTYMHTCMHTHTCMHACIHSRIHTYMHTYIHAHAYTHAYMHARIHACIHMYIYIPSPSALLQIEEFRKALHEILDESIVHQGLEAKTHEIDAEDTKKNKKDDTSGPDDVIPAEKPKQFRLCKIKDRFRTCVGPMDICVLHCTSPLSVHANPTHVHALAIARSSSPPLHIVCHTHTHTHKHTHTHTNIDYHLSTIPISHQSSFKCYKSYS